MTGLLKDYLNYGVVADLPAAPTIQSGVLGLFWATDTEELYWWNEVATPSPAWELISTGGGGGSTTLAALTDVDVTGVADGDVLTYDTGAGEWIPAAPAGGGGGGTRAVGSHSWWRIRGGGKRINTSYSAWSGLEFRSAPGGANVATGGTIHLPMPIQASSGPAGSIGGNGGSDFVQFDDDYGLIACVGYNFATPVALQEIAIYPMSFGVTRTPQVSIIEVSPDGIMWHHVVTHLTPYTAMTVGTQFLLPIPTTLPF